MRVATAGVVVLFAVTAGACGQEGEVADLQSEIKKTGKLIRLNTGVSDAVIQADARAIESAFPKLVDMHKKLGVTERETVGVAMLSWQVLRGVKVKSIQGPAKDMVLREGEELSPGRFLSASTRFGLLIVSSDPAGANVTLGSADWGSTKTKGWELPGQYTIRLQKDGYETVVETIEIKSGRQTYSKELKKKDGN
jgi:hypothetical protein